MTFIIAIQLEDSILVAADKRHVMETKQGTYAKINNDMESKLFLWKNGVITGTGEVYVIRRAVEFFIKLSQSNIQELSKCLKISRLIREVEVGDHFQVINASLLYSIYDEQVGAQLYTINLDQDQDNYQINKLSSNEIIIWLVNPDVMDISKELKELHLGLRAYSSFDSKIEWINYYLLLLSIIFQKQSQNDDMLTSANFNVYFQTKDQYYIVDHQNQVPSEPIKI